MIIFIDKERHDTVLRKPWKVSKSPPSSQIVTSICCPVRLYAYSSSTLILVHFFTVLGTPALHDPNRYLHGDVVISLLRQPPRATLWVDLTTMSGMVFALVSIFWQLSCGPCHEIKSVRSEPPNRQSQCKSSKPIARYTAAGSTLGSGIGIDLAENRSKKIVLEAVSIILGTPSSTPSPSLLVYTHLPSAILLAMIPIPNNS